MATAPTRIRIATIRRAVSRAQQLNPVLLYLGDGDDDTRWYAAQSHTDPGKGHLLKLHRGRISCTCPGFEQTRLCFHKAALGIRLNLIPPEWMPTSQHLTDPRPTVTSHGRES